MFRGGVLLSLVAYLLAIGFGVFGAIVLPLLLLLRGQGG